MFRKIIKKSPLCLAILCVSGGAVFAGTMGAACAPGDLLCEDTSRWEFGALALYLQPSFGADGLGYSAFSNYGVDFLGNSVERSGAPNVVYSMVPKWGWGFQVEGAYRPSAHTDIDLNWYHLHESTNGAFPTGTIFSGGAASFYAGAYQVTPAWDAVNLEVGYRHYLYDRVKARMHVGADFSRIKATFKTYPQLTRNSAPLFQTVDSNSYNGFGPRLGADLDYQVWQGASLYAKGAAALLVGSAKHSVSGYQDPTTLPYATHYSISNFNVSASGVVVPAFDAKLGLKYAQELAAVRGRVVLDVGYLWQAYLQPIVSYTSIGYGGTSSGLSTATNFYLNGLYFGGKWIGDL